MEAAGPEWPSFVLPVLNTANYSNDWHGEILSFMKQWHEYYGVTECFMVGLNACSMRQNS